MNHQTYHERLQLVQDILQRHGLKSTSVTPIDYSEADVPYIYNNFLYKVSLASPATAAQLPATQPLTTSPPGDGISTLVVRLSNPKARGLNQTNRTENEVSAIWLARQSLLSQNVSSENHHLADAIPAVYAWSAFETVPDRPDIGFGWLVMDFKPGVALNEHFSALSPADKTDILGQFADLFAAVQRAPIPASLGTLHCGMAIDNATGDIVPGQMSILEGGPWNGLVELWRARFREELGGADGSEIIGGWRANGVRDAVEGFMSSGLGKFLVDAGVDMNARSLIHGDFTTWNALFDPETKKITGLVDFDFSYISHPGLEFLISLGDIGGGFQPPHSGMTPFSSSLAKAILTGNFDNSEVTNGEDEEAKKKWEVARTWDEALKARGVLRPSSIAGMEALVKLRKLESVLAPFRLMHPHFTKKMTADEIVEARKKAEDAVKAALADLV
ncbi:putative phosphotransferase enzyme family protein [Echria macrotheca]|uniref:Phosphotransferase enzyme family protein n=1 Tax=Echria macrotheca TaxID=438768 RepID=A0AAJ0BIL5_9PEZI|nr:putative phosphotransferase enzyme family protein [Echria macrotheca]